MDSLNVRGLVIGRDKPKLAVPIIGRTEEEIIKIADKIDKDKVDLVEWRVDFFSDVLDTKKVLEVLQTLRKSLIDTPIIFTFRSKAEGGEIQVPIDYYLNLNKTIARAKLADLIDIEIFSRSIDVEDLIRTIHKEGIPVIGSNHDFLKTPSKEDMIRRLKLSEKMGADILKLAVMPKTPEDVLRLLSISNEMKSHLKKPIVTISMGELGTISRISGGVFGSSITFGALDKLSAPGQIHVDKLFDILKLI